MLLALVSLIIAIVPMVLNLLLVWRLDRYEREPLSMMLLNFLWGGTGAIIFSIVFSIQVSDLISSNDVLDTIAVAPMVEETIKGVFLLLVALNRNFDNLTDGIVYGMAIGLGFGMTENFLYFLGAESPEQWFFMVMIRTLFSASLHALATGIAGAGVGLTKYQFHVLKWPIRVLFLGLAMFVHFFWNYSVSVLVQANPAFGMGVGIVFIVFGVISLMLLLQIALAYEHRVIVAELAEEAASGLIPEDHLRFIPFSARRKYRGWLPVHVDPSAYIQAATLLAFRKRQLRSCAEHRQDQLSADVERLREKIRTALHPVAPVSSFGAVTSTS